jgi:peroxiredoxin Q/BCP
MTALWDRAAVLLALAGLFACLAWATGPAAAADNQKMPTVGEPAPDVSLPATQIDKVLPLKKEARTLDLKDLRGKNVVLYFFPKAMTPGCTIESCGFRDRIDELAKLDTIVIGISTDDLGNQEKFTDKEKLNFPLFADADKKVTKEYGVYNPDRGVANRSTFIIDKKGILRKIYMPGGVDVKKHPDEVVDYVKENLAKP